MWHCLRVPAEEGPLQQGFWSGAMTSWGRMGEDEDRWEFPSISPGILSLFPSFLFQALLL